MFAAASAADDELRPARVHLLSDQSN
jgi:hypothetical protein